MKLNQKILEMEKNKITPANGRSITIDAALNKFSNKVLFEKKVELAKTILAASPLPKGL